MHPRWVRFASSLPFPGPHHHAAHPLLAAAPAYPHSRRCPPPPRPLSPCGPHSHPRSACGPHNCCPAPTPGRSTFPRPAMRPPLAPLPTPGRRPRLRLSAGSPSASVVPLLPPPITPNAWGKQRARQERAGIGGDRRRRWEVRRLPGLGGALGQLWAPSGALANRWHYPGCVPPELLVHVPPAPCPRTAAPEHVPDRAIALGYANA